VRWSRACASRRIHAEPVRVTPGTATLPEVTPAPSIHRPVVTPGTATVPTPTVNQPTCIVREVRGRWNRTSERHHCRARHQHGVVTRQQLRQASLYSRMIARCMRQLLRQDSCLAGRSRGACGSRARCCCRAAYTCWARRACPWTGHASCTAAWMPRSRETAGFAKVCRNPVDTVDQRGQSGWLTRRSERCSRTRSPRGVTPCGSTPTSPLCRRSRT
jgi:hypothetical protein